jgi:hypothetical protein
LCGSVRFSHTGSAGRSPSARPCRPATALIFRADSRAGARDQIVDAIEARFGGLTDALNARANAALTSRLPHELIQDIQRIRHAFRGFKSAA